MISIVRTTTARVKRWKDTKMVRRWVGAGMLEAERSFRRIKGCKDMPVLVAAVRAEVARRVAVDALPLARLSHHPSTIRQQPESKWDPHRTPTTIGTSSLVSPIRGCRLKINGLRLASVDRQLHCFRDFAVEDKESPRLIAVLKVDLHTSRDAEISAGLTRDKISGRHLLTHLHDVDPAVNDHVVVGDRCPRKS